MLRLALFFLVVSIIAALFGFADCRRLGRHRPHSVFIAIVIFVVLLVAGLMAAVPYGSVILLHCTYKFWQLAGRIAHDVRA